MQIRTILVALAAVAVIAGCAVGNDRVKQLSTSSVEQLVVPEKTTRAEIEAYLGKPNMTQKEPDGTDVLEYTWMRQRPSAKNFIPLNVVDEFPTTKKSLRIWVDGDGLVKKYDFSGVFYVFRRPMIGANTTHSMRALTPEELDGLVDAEEVAAQADTEPVKAD